MQRALTYQLILKHFLIFSITSKTLPHKDIIDTIEDAVKDLQKEEADTICAKVSLTLQNSKHPKDNLSKDERKAWNECQSDTSIIILPADKGRSTVILNHKDYLEKCMDHINSGPHQLLKENPTTKIKTKTLKQLKVLKDNKFIDNKLYYYLKSIDLSAPRFYGQPKIHKGDPASSTTAEIYMQVHERTLITTALHSPKVWEQFAHKVYSIYKRTHLENFFHHINNLHQNIKFTGELASV